MIFLFRQHRFACGFIAALFLFVVSGASHPDLIDQITKVTVQLGEQRASPELYLQRADLFRRHGQFDAALTDLAAAERLLTNAPLLTLERARICCDAGHAEEAFETIQTFLKREPQHAEGLLIRARSRARLGQTEEAVLDYDAAINRSVSPTPDIFLERAHLQARLGKLTEAARGLDEAISNAPFASPLQLTAIEYDRQREAFDAALTRVDGLVARYPVKEPWLTLRAEVLEQAGRTSDAEKTFRQVIQGIEVYPPLRRTLDLTKQLEKRARNGLTRLAFKTALPVEHAILLKP